MLETPQLTYTIAATVVICCLLALGFFVREGVITANAYKQGVALYQVKNYKDAETAFRNVLSRHPSNDMVRLLLGEALMQQDKVEEAIAQWQELINRAPKNVDAYLRLGNALIKQDKVGEAIAVLETAKDLLKAQRNQQKAESVEQLLGEISTQQSLT